MGPCQGRQCALTVTELLADAHGLSQQAVGDYRLRTPVRPVTLAEIASLPHAEADLAAVERKWRGCRLRVSSPPPTSARVGSSQASLHPARPAERLTPGCPRVPPSSEG
jgi:hypothetical protein